MQWQKHFESKILNRGYDYYKSNAVRIYNHSNESVEAQLTRMAKDIRDRGFHVRLARDQDLKRLLAVYYQQDVTTEYFESVDGESMVSRDAD